MDGAFVPITPGDFHVEGSVQKLSYLPYQSNGERIVLDQAIDMKLRKILMIA